MNGLSGKVALVTGGSQGIGAAIALELAAGGATIAVNYYPGNEGAASSVVAQIESGGGHAAAFPGDVSDSASCTALVEAVVETLGSLDVLVNNAGITRDGLMVRMSDEDWGAVISTNLSGVFYMTRAASKVMMKARSGSIVNIASVVGMMGNAGQANYSAAKAGVIGLTKTTARELSSRGVRCPEAVREALAGQIALGRLGSPADVATAVAFLASDEASYVTGQVLAIDGGMTFA
jgi:3-oxoacyl-[acyl-carrier protein] reductase